ncbi:MAG TPA: hypothetical protein VFV53_05045 [Candidatus Limnocylindrales bacterium]|nr:hypothetical protein [Candidatus Limnocylindrales bacterium]
MPPDVFAGWAALLALGATIVGAVTLWLFFSRGGAWGKLNDAASVVLLVAMIPVALAVARIEADVVGIASVAVAALGIGAMVVVGVLQALLVADRVAYEQTKAAVLGGGALVGAWYVLVGVLAGGTALDGAMRWLAIAAGLGYIAIGYGFLAGNERHPLSVGGGIVLLVASCLFLGLFGVGLVADQIAVPA